MSWDLDDAHRLLHAAFPWKAHVTVESGSEFVSIRYEVLEEQFTDSTAMLRFERDPGDTLQAVRREQLEQSAVSGVLELDSGAFIRQPEPEDLHLLASPFRDLIGYQSPGESRWVARMRLHQSWWRTFRLRCRSVGGRRRARRTATGTCSMTPRRSTAPTS